ncbi:unnamed protein product [Schistosoma mattheei]|uniref:Uncharacterized protein n=1 Tax=Schistosoma mattheei TaxID=31246 RepID=A0A3P8HL79_9TREM|nr:unnamed protein product [Schistosoma mattheei]
MTILFKRFQGNPNIVYFLKATYSRESNHRHETIWFDDGRWFLSRQCRN